MQVGSSISHYKILEHLGGGGMGVVYKAQDTKLDRFVALKFLPTGYGTDKDEKQRFIHEAKAASALDHNNICNIHDIAETDEGQMYIVMACYAGETLKKKIERGNMKVDEAIDISIQVAEGLTQAHQKDIIHRDIKPANILVTEEGVVKIVDFGLAKLAGQTKLTKATTTLGTAAYMSPEQTRGDEVDRRADIWSFGVVLYEMLTGQLPFKGDYDQAVMYSILNEEPEPVTAVRTGIPMELEQIVNKALEKESDIRYQHVDDMLADLKRVKRDTSKVSRRQMPPKEGNTRDHSRMVEKATKKKWWVWPSLFVALVIVVAALVYFFRTRSETTFESVRITPFTSLPGMEVNPSFSPDGTQVAYSWNKGEGADFDIYVKRIGSDTHQQITSSPERDVAPTWSPDGRHIAFIRLRTPFGPQEDNIFEVSSIGGSERKLRTIDVWERAIGEYIQFFYRLVWSPDGKYITYPHRTSPEEPYSIYLLNIETMDSQRVTSPANGWGDGNMSFLPDSKQIVFSREEQPYRGNIYTVPISGGEPKRLISDGFHNEIYFPRLIKDGSDILFRRRGSWSLWRVKAQGGRPEKVMWDIPGNRSFVVKGQRGVSEFFEIDHNIWRIPLTSNDTPARKERFIASSYDDYTQQYSPDGSKIVFSSSRSGNSELWICNNDALNDRRITNSDDGYLRQFPQWSPNSEQIVFQVGPHYNSYIAIISISGGSPVPVTQKKFNSVFPGWSRDGNWIYFSSDREGTRQIWKVPLHHGEPVKVTDQPGGPLRAFESWDGQWLYYCKDDRTGIWKQPVNGGKESLVIEGRIGWGSFVVFKDRIYFKDYEPIDNVQHIFIRYLDLNTMQISTIANIGTRNIWTMCASPDYRWLLYTLEERECDLFLSENIPW